MFHFNLNLEFWDPPPAEKLTPLAVTKTGDQQAAASASSC